MIDLNLDTSGYDDMYRFASTFQASRSSTANLFEVQEAPSFTRPSLSQTIWTGAQQTNKKLAGERISSVSPLKAGGNVEAKIDISWGGKEGTEVNFGVAGEIHDNSGNYAKGELSQDSDGEGKVSISAGHKEE
jgi:hypothetical protein